LRRLRLHVRNVHDRCVPCPAGTVAALLRTLGAGDRDLVWPGQYWPRLCLDRPLEVGARGGHGAVRYRVTEYDPALGRVVFAFEPKGALGGFDGRHLFEALPCPGGTLLRHSVEAISDLTTAMRWLVMIRPIHDAAIEDALDRVELQLTGGIRQQTEWSPYVRWLRRRRGLSPRKEVGSAISA